jgi:hypothetical protein
MSVLEKFKVPDYVQQRIFLYRADIKRLLKVSDSEYRMLLDRKILKPIGEREGQGKRIFLRTDVWPYIKQRNN